MRKGNRGKEANRPLVHSTPDMFQRFILRLLSHHAIAGTEAPVIRHQNSYPMPGHPRGIRKAQRAAAKAKRVACQKRRGRG